MRLKTARAAIYTALIPVIPLIFQNVRAAGLAFAHPFLLLALPVFGLDDRYIAALFFCSDFYSLRNVCRRYKPVLGPRSTTHLSPPPHHLRQFVHRYAAGSAARMTPSRPLAQGLGVSSSAQAPQLAPDPDVTGGSFHGIRSQSSFSRHPRSSRLYLSLRFRPGSDRQSKNQNCPGCPNQPKGSLQSRWHGATSQAPDFCRPAKSS